MNNIILKIIDSFIISQRGIVKSIEILTSNQVIHIGDVFYDLLNNEHIITEIEIYRPFIDKSTDHYLIVLKNKDNQDVKGSLLFKKYDIGFLYCNHPLYKNKVDMDYEEEYQNANSYQECCLFSYEDLITLSQLTLYGEKIPDVLIYRGWMLKPEQYNLLYKKLKEKDIFLVNSPLEYKIAHLLPNWYKIIENETPFSKWTSDYSYHSIEQLLSEFQGSVIVKDFVKSRKHEWYEACFIEEVKERNKAREVIDTFIRRQDNDLVGGIVLREYVKLKQVGFHPKSGMPIAEEYRGFYFAGELFAIIDYWNTKNTDRLTENEIEYIKKIGKKIKSNFFTIDFARTQDGELIIIEVGDGQVSGLQEFNEELFYKQFYYLLSKD